MKTALRIKEIFKDKEMAQLDLALELGVSENAISDMLKRG